MSSTSTSPSKAWARVRSMSIKGWFLHRSTWGCLPVPSHSAASASLTSPTMAVAGSASSCCGLPPKVLYETRTLPWACAPQGTASLAPPDVLGIFSLGAASACGSVSSTATGGAAHASPAQVPMSSTAPRRSATSPGAQSSAIPMSASLPALRSSSPSLAGLPFAAIWVIRNLWSCKNPIAHDASLPESSGQHAQLSSGT
mmetsp:Transcript_52306/g.147251  ORF Transcript_52306/g.147251 Transcript_52306/m.147251 type:complete len:200 (+) Transcript_52306:1595-2194(+)